jgi:valacyclovir hydrolase
LGWSDGGITGMILAAQNNDIDKLVVWGANAYVTDKDIQLYKGILFIKFFLVLLYDMLIFFSPGIQDTSKWSEKMRKPLADVYGAEALQTIMTSWYNALKDILDKRSGDICRDLLQKIKSPTLVLHGVLDPLVPAEHPDYLISNINNAKYV